MTANKDHRKIQVFDKRLPRSFALTAGFLLAGILPVGQVQAVNVEGHVTREDGAPFAGAMVSVFNAAKDRKETVYTDATGYYAIRSPFTGMLDVRVRAHAQQDKQVTLDANEVSLHTVNFTLQPFADAQALSDSLTASAHLTQIRWPNEEARKTFVSQCNYCHQIGNALTRGPKEVSLWESTIARMEGYGALLTNQEVSTIAERLHEGFTGSPVSSMQKYDASDELARAKVLEWQAGDAMSFIHDSDVGQDGFLYGTDEGHDILWRLDRNTGEIRQFPLPESDLPQGGYFAAMQLPIGVFTGKHGPHSMAQGKDGRIWITNALSSLLMSFDPKTETFKSYPIDEDAFYLHTIRIDQKGMVWFTAAVSNKVVRFDPDTEKFTVLQLPHGGFFRGVIDYLFPYSLRIANRFWPGQNIPVKTSPHKWGVGRYLFNLPYGIDVNPVDGSVWYAKLLSSKIGRIDPETLEITEYDTPLSGPRRPRFDKQGVLWIPSFDESALMKFDTISHQFESYRLPLLAANEYETPYALNVHPDTQEIWITSNMSDRVLRFNPQNKSFVAYPSPTRVTWLRDMVFTQDGQVCSSSSNLPAYGIEGGRDAFYCIDPVGGETDRQTVSALKNQALQKN